MKSVQSVRLSPEEERNNENERLKLQEIEEAVKMEIIQKVEEDDEEEEVDDEKDEEEIARTTTTKRIKHKRLTQT